MAYTPVTWKSLTPSDNSGIFRAMNEADAQATAARQSMIDAISGFKDSRQEAAGDALTAALMQAGDNEAAREAAMNQALSGAFTPSADVLVKANQLNDSALDRALKQSQLDMSQAKLDWERDPDRLAAEREKIEADRFASRVRKYEAEQKAYKNAITAWALNGRKGPRPTSPVFEDTPINISTEPSMQGVAPIGTYDPNAPSEVAPIGPYNPQEPSEDVPAFQTYSVNEFGGPEVTPILDEETDRANAQAIFDFYFTPSLNASNEDWFNFKQDVLQDLRKAGISETDSNRIIGQAWGQYNRTPRDYKEAKHLDNIQGITQIATYGSAADQANLTQEDFVTAYGPDEGIEKYNTTQGNLYDQAIPSTEEVFKHSNPDIPITPAYTQNRQAYQHYNAFLQNISGYPESVQERFKKQYLSRNSLDKEVVASLNNALKADQTRAIREVTSKLQGDSPDLKQLSTQLQGIAPENLATVHDLMTGHLISEISNTKIGETSKFLRGMELKHVDEQTILSKNEQLNNFGSRINAYIDRAIPGASSATKTTLLENIKTRLGFDKIQTKIDNRKAEIKAEGQYRLHSDYNDFTTSSTKALMAGEKYTGNEHTKLEEQALTFIDQAIAKSKKEDTFPANTKLTPEDIRRIALKAFGDTFDAQDEVGEQDDWAFNTAWYGDDEIEEGLFSGKIDLTAGTNVKAYDEFTKRLNRYIGNVNRGMDIFVTGKAKTK